MATLGGEVLTLAEWAKRMKPDGTLDGEIAELLSQSTPEVEDIPFQASNRVTDHQVTQRTGLPTVTRRRINAPIQPSRSTTEQLTETMTMYSVMSQVDCHLPELAGLSVEDQIAKRFGEAAPQIESLGQTFADDIWNGDPTGDETQFQGFAARYASLGNQVLDAGGTGNDLSSIYLINWGKAKVYGIFPKNYKAGVDHKDWGEQLVQSETGIGAGMVPAFVDTWMWDAGLVVHDPRHVVRISNIESADVLGVSGTQQLTDYGTNILYLMSEALLRLPDQGKTGNPVFYMPRSVFIGLDRQVLARTNDNAFKYMDVAGQGPIATMRTVPCKISDRLGYTESALSS